MEDDYVSVSTKPFDQDEPDMYKSMPQWKIMHRARCLQGYTYVNHLGSGAFGQVFTFEKDNHQVAVKVQPVNESCIYEAQIMKKFSECGIGVTYIDHSYVKYKRKKLPFLIIVSEKVQGTLTTLLQTTQTEAILNEIGRQMFDIFLKMKTCNITHRDTHLQNIGYINLTDTTITLKLIDFGEGSHVRSYLDGDILRFGHDIFESNINSNYIFLQTKWWPMIKQLLSKSILERVVDDATIELFDEFKAHYNEIRFQTNVSLPQLSTALLHHVIEKASCTTDYSTSNSANHNNNMVNLTHKATQTSVTVQLKDITEIPTMLWENEQMITDLFYGKRLIRCFHNFDNQLFSLTLYDPMDCNLEQFIEENPECDLQLVWKELCTIITKLTKLNITCGNLSLHKIGVKSLPFALLPFDFSYGSMYQRNIDMEWLSLGLSICKTRCRLQDLWYEFAPMPMNKYTLSDLQYKLNELRDKHHISRLLNPSEIQTL
jgi:hypothetical protein